MARYCEYCGLSLSDLDSVCPNCGAPAPDLPAAGVEPEKKRTGIPRTMRELRAFCSAHRMPLEQMRFFIGQNLREPRVFGIYQDGDGDFVVYKNKADGTRAVRYKGPDEAHAVREIYLKLKEETDKRFGARYVSPSRTSAQNNSVRQKKKSKAMNKLLAAILAIVLGVGFLFAASSKSPSRGYYRYQDDYYYYQNGDWYYYSDSMLDWVSAGFVDQELEDNYSDYYESSYYRDSFDFEDFEDSSYYVPNSDSSSRRDYDDDSSWENDSSWDNDYSGWDAGDTDWDSDW